MTSQTSNPQIIKSVAKAMEVLCTFLEGDPSQSLAEISQKVGFGKSTTYRLLHTLKDKGMVRQDPRTGRYLLGLKLLHLSSKALAGISLRSVSRPHLETLSRAASESVHLACLSGREAIFIDKIPAETSLGLRMTSYVGRVVPLYCTSVGKALLAHQEEVFKDQYLENEELKSFTPNTLTDRARLRDELRAIAVQGYAVDREELTEGIMCYACPVLDDKGRTGLAISVTGAISQMKTKGEQLLPHLHKAARELAQDIAVSGLDFYVGLNASFQDSI